jgi:hypothetical protein
MGAPEYSQPSIDPMLSPLMAQGQQQDIAAMQENLRGDTASLLARYGAQLVSAQNPVPLAAGPLGKKTATYGEKVA